MNILERFYILFESKTDGVKKGADEAKKHVDGVADHVKKADEDTKKLAESFMKVATAIGKVAAELYAINFLKDGVIKAIGDNAGLERLSQQIRANANDLQAWDRAAQTTGAGAGDLTGFLHGLYTQYAQMGRGDLIDGILDKLTEWNRKAATMSKDDSFRMFSQMEVPESVIKFLQMAPDQFDAIIAKQHQLGDTSQAMKDKSIEWSQEMVTFHTSLEGLFTSLIPPGVFVLHMLEDMISTVRFLIDAPRALLNGNFGEYIDSIRGIGQTKDNAKNAWGGAPSTQSSSSTSGSTIGLRNNNPGNLRSWGGVPTSGGFAHFATMDAGLAAEKKQLQLYGQRGINTIADIISTWAPSNENDTAAYIAAVTKSTGFSAGQHLNMNDPAVIEALMRGINKHENGFDPFPAYAMQQAQRQINFADTAPIGSMGSSAGGGEPSNVNITVSGITINTQATDVNGVASALADNLKLQLRTATGNWNDGIQK